MKPRTPRAARPRTPDEDPQTFDEPVSPALHVSVTGGVFARLSTGELSHPFNLRVELNNQGRDIRLDYALNEFQTRKPRAGLVIEMSDRHLGLKSLVPYVGGEHDVTPGSAMVLYWELPPHRMFRTPVTGQLKVVEHDALLGTVISLDITLSSVDGQQVRLKGKARLPPVKGEALG